MGINKDLIRLARHTTSMYKVAFQPPGGDPAAAGGAPPMDPAMMGGGGAPPMDPAMMGGGGAPPMDPAMMGGAPPMDPAMMGGGGAPPPPPPADPAAGGGGGPLDMILQKLDQLAMQSPQMQQGPGGAPGAPGKPGKPDLLAMSMDIFQLKKMQTAIMNALNVPIPQEIIDGPNRDPSTGAPMPPGMPGSTSDPSRPSTPMGGGGAGGGAGGGIEPIQPFSGGGGAGGGMGEKAGAAAIGDVYLSPQRMQLGAVSVRSKAAALATCLRSKQRIA